MIVSGVRGVAVTQHKCGTCRYFEEGGFAGSGRCSHPLRKNIQQMVLVRKSELACRTDWASDLWEPIEEAAPVPIASNPRFASESTDTDARRQFTDRVTSVGVAKTRQSSDDRSTATTRIESTRAGTEQPGDVKPPAAAPVRQQPEPARTVAETTRPQLTPRESMSASAEPVAEHRDPDRRLSSSESTDAVLAKLARTTTTHYGARNVTAGSPEERVIPDARRLDPSLFAPPQGHRPAPKDRVDEPARRSVRPAMEPTVEPSVKRSAEHRGATDTRTSVENDQLHQRAAERGPAPSSPNSSTSRPTFGARPTDNSLPQGRSGWTEPFAVTPPPSMSESRVEAPPAPPQESISSPAVAPPAGTPTPVRTTQIRECCGTCRDFRPAEGGERGWCNNAYAFDHRRMVERSELACRGTIGSWWIASDDWWLQKADIAHHGRPTPIVDDLLRQLLQSRAVSQNRRSGRS